MSNPSDRRVVRAEFSQADADYLAAYREAVARLSACVIEMMTTERTLLLSPVFRDLVLAQARQVADMHQRIHLKLIIDNPGLPLEPGS